MCGGGGSSHTKELPIQSDDPMRRKTPYCKNIGGTWSLAMKCEICPKPTRLHGDYIYLFIKKCKTYLGCNVEVGLANIFLGYRAKWLMYFSIHVVYKNDRYNKKKFKGRGRNREISRFDDQFPLG